MTGFNPRLFRRLRAALAMCISLGSHAAFAWSLPGSMRGLARNDGLSDVEVALVEQSPEPDSKPEPEPPERKLGVEDASDDLREDPTPEPTNERPSRPAATQPDAPDATEPAKPVDFTDMMLSNEGEANPSWGLNATAESGPVRRGPRRPGSAPGGGVNAGKAGNGGLGTVPLGSLSRRPVPPDLNGALERNYPRQAKQEGVEGVASVRAVVSRDGSITNVKLVSETVRGYAFGEACRRTLAGTRWSPPLDRQGRPVSTTITYRCEFRVRF